jgi:hypothetical protein
MLIFSSSSSSCPCVLSSRDFIFFISFHICHTSLSSCSLKNFIKSARWLVGCCVVARVCLAEIVLSRGVISCRLMARVHISPWFRVHFRRRFAELQHARAHLQSRAAAAAALRRAARTGLKTMRRRRVGAGFATAGSTRWPAGARAVRARSG